MTRGLKGNGGRAGGWHQGRDVTLIDPMTRGLKDQRKIISLRLLLGLHWLTRWQGDWKGVDTMSQIPGRTAGYTDWPDDKGTESSRPKYPFQGLSFLVTLIDPMTRGLKGNCPFSKVAMNHLVTLIDPMTRGLKGTSRSWSFWLSAALHWLTRWQGDWKS